MFGLFEVGCFLSDFVLTEELSYRAVLVACWLTLENLLLCFAVHIRPINNIFILSYFVISP